ncbi:MAG: hypothetical protein ACD_23C00179G0002 [uncultured bacterium]|nr:MAG: hypothetical protein ACD_23C00179G0002 [uncultured bacterium]
MKLVKTNQPVLCGNPFGQKIQRIGRALHTGQFPVHLAHEFMKMQPRFALQWHGCIKAIHQEALAPTNAAIHVNTTRNGWAVDQFFECIGAHLAKLAPLAGASFQRLNRAQLRRIRAVTTRQQLGLVDFFNGHL